MCSNAEDTSSDSDLSENFEKRFLHLLDNGINCDCEFIIGSQKLVVNGHKLLFSAASEVFQAMFNGDLKEDKIVKIEDLEPEGFQGMRHFIYTGKVSFPSALHALFVYTASRKYLIPALSKECISFIREEKIQPSEVLEFYEYCKTQNIPEFEDLCYKIIQEKTNEVVESEYFLSAKIETIEIILKSPFLKLKSEMDIFCHFERWAISEAQRKGIGVQKWMSGNNYLKKHIRFLTISSEDFFSTIAGSLLLTPDEKIAIACNLKRPESKPMPENLSLQLQHRKFVDSSSMKPIDYRYQHTFSVSIAGPCNSCSEYTIAINQTCFTYKITPLKTLDHILFQVEPIIEDWVIETNLRLFKMRTKIRVLAEKSYDDLVFEIVLFHIWDWSRKDQNKMIIANIPISGLKNKCFMRGTTDTVTIVASLDSAYIDSQHL